MNTTDDKVFNEQLPSVCSIVSAGARKVCKTSNITNKFPILQWLPRYKPKYLINDAIAGFTVGLTTIPQGIAYGVIAGLGPQYGLYTAFMGCFTYIFFGACKDVTIATTAIMALMVHDDAIISADYAVLTCFLAGCIILILGLLNLGVLVRFISIPVILGFTMAAATTIASAQVNNIFGLASPSNKLVLSWAHFFTHFDSIRTADTVLGLCSLTYLLTMKQAKKITIGHKMFWKYVSLSRNAVVVVVGTFLAYELSHDGVTPFRVTGNITAGLPPFKLPPFSTTVNGVHVPFSEMISRIGYTLASVSLVSVLEIVAISKAFSKGKLVDASQQMVALGMCNIMGSFVSSMPVTGSFTRTAVNYSSGVKTVLGGAVTGAMVIMALAFLTETFYYIPKTTLAAVIIAAMISIFEVGKLIRIWKSKRLDVCPFFVTYIISLFWSLEYGILCGIATNLGFILCNSARPQIVLYKQKVCGHSICVADVKQRLDFASAEYLKEKIIKFINEQRYDEHIIIVKGHEINSIDFTVAENIITLRDDLEVLGCKMICWNWNIVSAGVICRLNPNMRDMFKFNVSIEEIVTDYFRSTANGSNATIFTQA